MDQPLLLLWLGITAGVVAISGLLFFRAANKTPVKEAWLLSAVALGAVVFLIAPLALLAGTGRFQPDRGWIILVTMPLGVVALSYSLGAFLQAMFLKHLPKSPVDFAAQGFVKVAGTAEPGFGTVFSKTGRIECLYYSEVTERYVMRTETYYDSSSKTTKTRTVYRWETIDRDSDSVPFLLRDDTGQVEVDNQRVEYHTQTCAHYYNGQSVGSWRWGASVGDIRTKVQYLPPRASVTVFGRLIGRRIAYDTFRKCFLICEGDGKSAASSRSCTGFFLFLLGMALTIGSLVVVIGVPDHVERSLTPELDLFAGAAGVGVLLAIWLIRARNQLVRLRKEAEGAWANIDVALKRRWDLIPNVVATVKEIARHESEVLVRLTEERAKAMQAARDQEDDVREARIEAEDAIERAVPRLWRHTEAYPQLQSSQAFLQLQRQLVETEEEIADKREMYNQCASNFNEAHETFPLSLVASMVGAAHLPLFEAEPAERAAPTVKV
jgi:LemA protein